MLGEEGPWPLGPPESANAVALGQSASRFPLHGVLTQEMVSPGSSEDQELV